MTRLTPLAALIALMALSACNTTAGFGQDVESTGEFITEEANEVQSGL
jgi:predicted small secreted protein